MFARKAPQCVENASIEHQKQGTERRILRTGSAPADASPRRLEAQRRLTMRSTSYPHRSAIAGTAPSRLRVRTTIVAALASVAVMLIGASSASAAQFWLNNSHTVPTTHCYTGYGPSSYTDLLPAPPSGATSTAFGGQVLFGCTPS